jgi:PKD repeat protein
MRVIKIPLTIADSSLSASDGSINVKTKTFAISPSQNMQRRTRFAVTYKFNPSIPYAYGDTINGDTASMRLVKNRNNSFRAEMINDYSDFNEGDNSVQPVVDRIYNLGLLARTETRYNYFPYGNLFYGRYYSAGYQTSTGLSVNIFPYMAVYINNVIDYPVVDFSASNTSICSGNSVSFTDFTTGSPSSWNWSFSPSTITFINGTNASSKNPVVSFPNAGTFTVSLTATNTQGGSTTKTKTGYIIVTQSATPIITINIGSANLCSGQSAMFTSSISNGGTIPNYNWEINGVTTGSNNSTFSSLSLNNNDTVSCILTSNATCVNPLTASSNKIGMTINSSPAVPIISQNVNILNCNLIGVSYQWYFNNLIISGATNQSYTILQSGVYKIIVTNSSNCTNTSLDFNALKSGINELTGMSNFLLYPNPAKDFISLQFFLAKTKNITFTVVDLLGRKVFEETKECQSGNNIHQLHFWLLTKGNYVLQLKDGLSIFQRSIMIE